jgi:hypothetical protein
VLEDETIELTIECIARKRSFKNGYIGLFWASYIHQPESTAIQFLGHPDGGDDRTPRWVRATTPRHGEEATHRGADDDRVFAHDADFPMKLVFSNSRWRFDEPWYFGASHGMAFVQVFRGLDGVRLTQSPSGGGKGNPAWDFQFFIPEYEVGRVYRFVARAAYLPLGTPEEMRRVVEPHLRALRNEG